MNTNGQVIKGEPEGWKHLHTCYTCQVSYVCTWMYCKEQLNRNCPGCIAALRKGYHICQHRSLKEAACSWLTGRERVALAPRATSGWEYPHPLGSLTRPWICTDVRA